MKRIVFHLILLSTLTFAQFVIVTGIPDSQYLKYRSSMNMNKYLLFATLTSWAKKSRLLKSY